MHNWSKIVVLLLTVLSINKIYAQSPQQITFNSVPAKTFGDLPFDLEASATSGLPVQFTSSNPAVAIVNGKTVTVMGAGESIITASQAGDGNFTPAVPVQQTLVVRKADQTITFPELPTKTFGDFAFALAASSTSGLAVTYSSSNVAVATITGNTVVIRGAGSCIITASQAGDANYHAAPPVGRSLTVNKAAQVISFGSIPPKKYGDQPFSLSSFATSGLAVVLSSNSSLISIAGNQVTILGAGVAEITASQPGNSNFLPAVDVVQHVTIEKASQTITFNSLPAKTFGDPSFVLTASASSGLAITFISEYDSLLTIQGNLATIVGAGELKVYATQPGNENYLPKVVEQTLIINKAPQVIVFDPLGPKKFGDSPFSVFATASSGLPISFSSNRKTVARVDGTTVTIKGAGTANIAAMQEGNANYLPAPHVIQPLVVAALGNSYPLLGIARTGGNGRGTIFNVNTNGSAFTLQKNFSPNAYNGPQSGLIKGSDGKLYGMIMAGGTPSNGVVFSLQPDGSGYVVLHNFSFTDGQRPFGNIMEASDGYLYGMTYDGGVNNTGVLFRIRKDGSAFSKLYEFPDAGANGYHPLGGLIESAQGDLFGMTAEGGAGSYGVIFTIKKDGSGYTKLVEWDGAALGGFPRGNLLQGPDSYLYGTTVRGGGANQGVLFKVKPDGTDYRNLVEFDGASRGSAPGASLILGMDGKLYGTTQSGGTNDKGVVFSIKPDGTQFIKLFDFAGLSTGGSAIATLTQSSADGYLYGLTNQGGVADLGVVFRIKTDGTGFTKLLDFTGTNGASPVFGPLLEVGNGQFVGMTSRGGPSNSGIVFSVTADGTFGLVKDFPQPEGTPEIISSASDTHYFGVASSGGPKGNGVIFKTEADGSGYEKIHDLEGNFFYSNKLVHTSDGQLWGSATEGVFTQTSVLFRLKQDGSGFQRVQFNNAPGLSVGYLMEGPDKFLYGWGYVDGAPDGIIFKFKTDGTNFVRVTNLPGGLQGSHPTENLVFADGNLFGLTQDGGIHNSGTVFKVDLATHQFVRIFSLQAATTGAYPKKLALLNDKSLCIATAVGGNHDAGSLFSISADGNDYNKIYDFSTAIVSGPTDIIHTVDGYLVGLTEYGGASNNGTIFELLTDGSDFKKIFEFNGVNGSSPEQLYFRKATQVISFASLPAKQYNDPDFLLECTVSSGLPITFTSSNPAIASIYNGNMVKVHAVGEVVITASVAGNVNFLPAQVSRTLEVTKADQEIAFDPIQSVMVGGNAFSITATTTSGLPVEFSTTSNHILLAGNTITTLHPGSVTVHANQSGNLNYQAAPTEQQTFCVYPTQPIVTPSEVTFVTAVLTSSYANGNQWYRNGELLPNETSQTLIISEDGIYTVITSVEGCASEQSEPYTMVITGTTNDVSAESALHPNPATEKVYLNLSTFEAGLPVDIQIFDSKGRKTLQRTLNGQPEVELDIHSLSTGAYILKASGNGRLTLTKFIKQ